MSSPYIKIYQMPRPVGVSPSGTTQFAICSTGAPIGIPVDIQMCSSTDCPISLIERAVDYQHNLSVNNTTYYTPAEMIHMRCIASVSCGVGSLNGYYQFEIDTKDGSHPYGRHDPSVVASCNLYASGNRFVVASGYHNGLLHPLPLYTALDSDYLRGLSLQVFVNKQMTYEGQNIITEDQRIDDFTFIPIQGGYSSNLSGEPPVAMDGEDVTNYYIGRQYDSIWQLHSTDIASGNSSNPYYWAINYTIEHGATNDYINIRKSYFDAYFGDSHMDNVYTRCWIHRDTHSSLAKRPQDIQSDAFGIVPHNDFVASQSITVATGSESCRSATFNPDTGVVCVSLLNINGTYQRTVNMGNLHLVHGAYASASKSIAYHTWPRISNDDIRNLQFYMNDISYNEDESWCVSPRQITQRVMPLSQHADAQYYAFSDLYLVNEGTAPVYNLYITGTPRGVLTESYGSTVIDKLLNKYRPWDHQEGSEIETYDCCFVRCSYEYLWNSIGAYVVNEYDLYTYRRWYESSPSSGTGNYFRLLPSGGGDVYTNTSQSQDGASSITLLPSGSLFVRAIYTLDRVLQESLTLGPKAFSLRVQGFEEV